MPLPPSNRMQPSTCPVCGYVMDANAPSEGEAREPKDGDLALCMRCGEPAIFVVGALGTSLRPPTDQEREKVMLEWGQEIAAYRNAIAQAKRMLN